MSTTKYDRITLKFNDLDGNPISKQIRVVGQGYTLYFNCQHQLVQLGTHARCFFDYLCEQMATDTNEVIIDNRFKEGFVDHISRITSTKVSPSINSLNKYVSKFKELGLIIPTVSTQREFYAVNPKYAYKGQKKDRLELLANMIKERIANGNSLRGLVDTPEHELGINYDGIK
jgi:hypothetical protein